MTDQDSHPQPITAQLMPRVPGVLAGRPNTVDVLVRIQGPAAAPAMSRRTPLNLALVLDRSGSMGGRPLFEAIGCAPMTTPPWWSLITRWIPWWTAGP